MLRCKLFNIPRNFIFYIYSGTSAQVSERAYEPLDSGIHVLVLCRDNFSWSCSVILNRFFSFYKLLSLHEHRHWFAPNKSSTCHIPSKLVCSMHNFHWCSYLDISIIIVWFIRISKILGDPWFYIELFLLNVYKTIIISYFNHLTLVE